MGEQIFLERFLWFDNEVRRGRYPNARKLAEHFEQSNKTAQRSIEYFRDRLLAPLEYDFNQKGYFYTEPDFQLPMVHISEDELLALLISRKLITEASGGLLGEELGGVSEKLGSILAVNLPGRAHPEEAFSFYWRSISHVEPHIFRTVTAALMQCNPLSFSYKSPASIHTSRRTVEPHHMVNYMGNWHLIAYCRLRNDWRDFLLGRMENCRAEETSFQIRPVAEWQPFLEETFGIYQNREKFDVVLRFSPERSRWVKDEIWHKGQKQHWDENGSLVRTIPVSHDAEIMMEILKHGSHVTVIAPEKLRDKVAHELMCATRNYY